MQTPEREKKTYSGWPFLFIDLPLPVLFIICLATAINRESPILGITSAVIAITFFLILIGMFTLQPNQAAVLVLFGNYKGTTKKSGFHWANPFFQKIKISLRARNHNGEKIKVNDLHGNPIEIAAVVVWRVQNTAEAVFDVDDYENYVAVQSEAAVRFLASMHPYDSSDDVLSLRGNSEEIALALQNELQDRLNKAGVVVEEARISHLAYAPEIASAMLQRQQADAIVAARERIVDGAVGMVEMALQQLEEKHTVELDEERKAAMVSNLLVVLCSDKAANPVINAGTLYN